jgi:hypothetical protein
MKAEDLALVQGWDDTRATLRRWNAAPAAVLVPWARGSLLVAVALLFATWLVALYTTPDPSPVIFPGVSAPATGHDFAFVLFRNGLVLALHALACVAGFIAGSSLPQVAKGYTGIWRTVHDHAGRLAIGFVVAATLFSLATQAYALGGGASTLAAQLGITRLELMIGLLPHALPELVALFLPLAAWTMASRRDAWHELLAATFATVALAVPVLLAAAAVEVWVTPRVLIALSG